MFEDKEKGTFVESDKEAASADEPPLTPDGTGVVDWDGPNDPNNPMNWPSSRKWTIISLISFNTFNAAMASTLFAPSVSQVIDEFNTKNSALSSLVVSVYIIGFAVGPLVFAPLSELYGRLPITNAANVLFLISSIICAVSVNMPMLIVFRLVMGIAGCVPMTLGGAFIADLMSAKERGSAMTWWTVGPLMGPVLSSGDTWPWESDGDGHSGLKRSSVEQ
ncbi:resistance protein [Aspergillus sclerotialis]|uniref:Resistance protein n=1 Tax=Aspergillus sclerotialis TaxID=2070753 RepID=A0A3A2ZBS8_9EURO|nr:resistance protein [Aspergillus sclerotialis]